MRLASLRREDPADRDGELVVVSTDLKRLARARDIAPTLQAALDDWARAEPRLRARDAALRDGTAASEPFDHAQALSPLPRAFQWVDGSTYWPHEVRMSRWRGIPPRATWHEDPGMYQGASDSFLAPNEDIPCGDPGWGLDFEGEIAAITDAVPFGVAPAAAAGHIRLLMLCNDVSLRELIPGELAKGFGFVQSKPASAFAPVAVTPDALGEAWRDHRLHLRLRCSVNGSLFGDPDAGEMAHGFDRLVSHAARTRTLGPGTIVGGGTVSSEDPARGTACITERRVLEATKGGSPRTPFLQPGDRVRLEVLDAAGQSVFGTIDQVVGPVRSA